MFKISYEINYNMSGFVFLKFLNLELTILLKLVCMKISPFVWNLFKNKKKRQDFFFSPKSSMVLGSYRNAAKKMCTFSCSLNIFRSNQGVLVKLTCPYAIENVILLYCYLFGKWREICNLIITTIPLDLFILLCHNPQYL